MRYAPTPMGLFDSLNAYSTMVLFFDLHRIMPIEGLFISHPDLVVQHSKIKLHLTDIFRDEFAYLEFDCHKAFQCSVIKQKVNEIFLTTDLKPVLTARKAKTPPISRRNFSIFEITACSSCRSLCSSPSSRKSKV